MWLLVLKNLVLPLAVSSLNEYVKDSSSTKDDKVLELVKVGAKYLSEKPNNTVSKKTAQQLKTDSIKKIQG